MLNTAILTVICDFMVFANPEARHSPAHDMAIASGLCRITSNIERFKIEVERPNCTYDDVVNLIEMQSDLGDRCFALGAKWIASKFYMKAAETAASKSHPGPNGNLNNPQMLASFAEISRILEEKSKNIQENMKYDGLDKVTVVHWQIDPDDIVNDFTLKCAQRDIDVSQFYLKYIKPHDNDYVTPFGLGVVETNKANDMLKEFEKVRHIRAILGKHAVNPLFFLSRDEYGPYDEFSLAYAMEKVWCMDGKYLYVPMSQDARRTFGAFDEIVHQIETLDRANEPLGDPGIRLRKSELDLQINNFLISMADGGERFEVVCNDPWAWNYERGYQPIKTPRDAMHIDEMVVKTLIQKLFELFAP